LATERDFIVFKIHAAWPLLLLLTACGAPTIKPKSEPGRAGPVRAPAGSPAYQIDAAQSELRVLVYRAGPLARLGHNHVIINRKVAGWVDAKEPLTSGSFSLRVPVTDFEVDDAQVRGEEGEDFSGVVPEDAKSGTLHNMLGAALLDADRYSSITLTSMAIRQEAGKLLGTITVALAGHESSITVPFTLEASADRVTASGTAVLRQSELGLTPISVMLGALQVRDEVTVKFKFVALKSHP
jgi:polyisoprenoid-binding protein YceI